MKRDYIRKLYEQGKIESRHLLAAAKFEKLVYSGYASRSLNLDRVQGTPHYSPNLSGLRLGKLPSHESKILTLVIIKELPLVDIGVIMGAKSRMTSYRRGLEELISCLETAYDVLC